MFYVLNSYFLFFFFNNLIVVVFLVEMIFVEVYISVCILLKLWFYCSWVEGYI